MSRRRQLIDNHPWLYYLFYIPLAVVLFLWPIAVQPLVIYSLIIGGLPTGTDVPWWYWLIGIASWFTIPIYGMILVLFSWWLQDLTPLEREIDRIERHSVVGVNVDHSYLQDGLNRIGNKVPESKLIYDLTNKKSPAGGVELKERNDKDKL